MSSNFTNLQQNQKNIEAHQHKIVDAAIWRCCLNCEFWDAKCKKFDQIPPPKVIVYGCMWWQFEIPF